MPDEFNDAADWTSASYIDDPVDHIEPPEPFTTEYQACARKLLDVLAGIDEYMSAGRPSRKWLGVSLALGLASTRGKTETAIATEWGVTRAAISKDVCRVLRLSHLEHSPAFGLKSHENRKTYMRTNGHRVQQDKQPATDA